MKIGRNIKKCRIIKKKTQKEISEGLGINIRTYQKYESGDISPNINTLELISGLLEVDLEAIINWTDLLDYDPDAIYFLEKLLPTYNFSSQLANLLGENESNPEFIQFLNGKSNNSKFYLAISNILDLSDTQIYNWILSDIIYNLFGYDNYKYTNISKDDIKNILSNNLLIEQNINDLLMNGLSDDNKNIISEYFSKKTTLSRKIGFDLSNYILSDNETTEDEKKELIELYSNSSALQLTRNLFRDLGYKIDLIHESIAFIKNIETDRDVAKITFDDLMELSNSLNFMAESAIYRTINQNKIDSENLTYLEMNRKLSQDENKHKKEKQIQNLKNSDFFNK